MRLDRSEVMCVHVSTCTSYDFNVLTPVVMCVFLRLVAKTTDRFLEKRINIKFCVKLGKVEKDTCAMLS
jgi:hypothetical protein